MSLLRSSATVGGLTLISRVLGFVRDILIAGALGTGPVADAFVVAFRFPNLFRRFFAEGAFNSAFVPLFAKTDEGEGREAAKRFAEDALSVLLTALLVLTAIAEIAMPWLMSAIAPGYIDDPERFDLSVLFTRIAFPYLTFMSLVALFSGILNSLGRFSAAALAPVLLNVILVGAIVFVAPYTRTPGHALVWGVALAGFAQLAMLVWAAARSGIWLRLRRPRITPMVRRLMILGVPGIVAGGITQINLVIGQFIATFQDGAVSILYYADRIYQFPLGLIGVAMGVVLLPQVARSLRAGNEADALASQNRALELSMLLTVPSAVACAVIALPIIRVLYEATSHAALGSSAFTSQDSRLTAQALTAFACGLPAFVLIKVFQPGFFAREDTATPMRYAAVNTAVNVTLGVALFWLFGLVGLAVATSAAAWVNAWALVRRLKALGHFQLDARAKARLPRILLAAGGMGVFLWGAAALVAPWLDAGYGWQIAGLAVLVLGGMGAYAGLAFALGAMHIADLKAEFSRKGRTKTAGGP